MIINEKIRSGELVTTGVIHNNNAEWLIEDIYEGIDLDFMAHTLDCDDCHNDQDCDISEYWEMSSSTILINFVECESDDLNVMFTISGKHGQLSYKPDTTKDYAAIVGEVYTQVVHSHYYSLCNECSPCYPDQGDLDTAGDIKAFTLPPDLFGDYDDPLPVLTVNL